MTIDVSQRFKLLHLSLRYIDVKTGEDCTEDVQYFLEIATEPERIDFINNQVVENVLTE